MAARARRVGRNRVHQRQVFVAARARRWRCDAAGPMWTMAVVATHRAMHAGRAIGVAIGAAFDDRRTVWLVAVDAGLVILLRERGLLRVAATACGLLLRRVRIVAANARGMTVAHDRRFLDVTCRARRTRSFRRVANRLAVTREAVVVLWMRLLLRVASAAKRGRRFDAELVRLVTAAAIGAAVKRAIRARFRVATRACDGGDARVRRMAAETTRLRRRILRGEARVRRLRRVAGLACRARAYVVLVVAADALVLAVADHGELVVAFVAAADDFVTLEAMRPVTGRALRVAVRERRGRRDARARLQRSLATAGDS